MARHRRRILVAGMGIALVVSLAIGIGTAAAGKSSKSAVSPLRKACGAKIVVQTDWFPEPEHGFIYQLAGTNGVTDTKKGHYWARRVNDRNPSDRDWTAGPFDLPKKT